MVDSTLLMFIICPFGLEQFYIGKIVEFKQEETKQHDKAMKTAKSKRR